MGADGGSACDQSLLGGPLGRTRRLWGDSSWGVLGSPPIPAHALVRFAPVLDTGRLESRVRSPGFWTRKFSHEPWNLRLARAPPHSPYSQLGYSAGLGFACCEGLGGCPWLIYGKRYRHAFLCRHSVQAAETCRMRERQGLKSAEVLCLERLRLD